MTSDRMRVLVGGKEYPLTLSTGEVATLFDCSPELLQRQVGTGRLPCEPLRLGNRLRWPTLMVAAAVGLVTELIEGDMSAAGSETRGAGPASDEALVGEAS